MAKEISWYTGSIIDAINQKKDSHFLMLVYIYGDDDNSKAMDDYWSNEKVLELSSHVICLKLKNGSDDCFQFSQYYPIICVPSAFLIGESGGLLGAYAYSDLDTLLKTFQLAKEEHEEKLKQNGLDYVEPNTVQPKIDKEKVQELLQNVREVKQEKEIEEAKKNEIERRELGRNVNKLREWQQTRQVDEEASSRAKERQAEIEARERVKRQIMQDREERRAKYLDEQERIKAERRQIRDKQTIERVEASLSSPTQVSTDDSFTNQVSELRQRHAAKYQDTKDKSEEEAKLKSADKARKSLEEQNQAEVKKMQTCRIMVRFPDGSNERNVFLPADTLAEVRKFVVEKIGNRFGKRFFFCVPHPRHIFSTSDENKSLMELNLVPSSVLLLVKGTAPRPGSDDGPSDARRTTAVASISSMDVIFSYLLWPFLLIWNVFSSFFSTAAPPSGSTKTDQANVQDRGKAPVSANRQGNFQKFTNSDDKDDDESATWNGNSTQQM